MMDVSLSPPRVAAARPKILCLMRMPPDLNGHGGSQRAWHLLQALQPLGEVHFVLLYRDVDADCVGVPLAHLQPFTASITSVCISAWNPTGIKKFKVLHPWLVDIFKFRSQVAPRFGKRDLREIAARLPLADPDVIFACRLEMATVVQDLIDAGLLRAAPLVVDFDDIMSRFKERQIASMGPQWGLQGPVLAKAEVRLIRAAEDRIAKSCRGVSVCTDEDVTALRERYPGQAVVKIPNIIVRERLAPRQADGRFKILFAGNLRFYPNVDGLKIFVEQAWPAVLAAVPRAELMIVGMNPLPDVVEIAAAHGFALHANVPAMQPYYEDCDAVIAPILFGSGTRIKILEAMAYGRAIVSTSIGAEGLYVTSGQELMLADAMPNFAQALVALAGDANAREVMVERAHAHQIQYFGREVLNKAVSELLAPALSATPA
jgi:glycosyltransferase involved in cell wall biosynthesis